MTDMFHLCTEQKLLPNGGWSAKCWEIFFDQRFKEDKPEKGYIVPIGPLQLSAF